MENNIHEMLNELFDESKNNNLKIKTKDDSAWSFNIKFFVEDEGELNATNKMGPILKISDRKLFEQKLNEYLAGARKYYKDEQEYYFVDDENFDKLLTSFLFANATFYDFENPIQFLEKQKEMLKFDVKPETVEFGVLNLKGLGDVKLVSSLTKNKLNLESPLLFLPAIESATGEKYHLPAISFGLEDSEASVYAVQNRKDNETSTFSKKVDRALRKANEGIEEKTGTRTEDKKQMMEELKEKPIELQVSPSAVVSITMFFAYLKKYGMENVKAYNYFPVRNVSNKTTAFRRKKQEINNDEVLESYYRDQFNATNKMSYLFLRYAQHFDESLVDYDEYKSEISLELGGHKQNQNHLLYDIEDVVLGKNPEKIMQ